MLALLEGGRVVGGENVLYAGAPAPQADRRVGVDPFRAQPFHLRAAFVEFDDPVAARLLGGAVGHGLLGLCVLRIGLLLLLILCRHLVDDPPVGG